MANILLKTALKNAVVRTNRANNYEFHLNNISINGDKRLQRIYQKLNQQQDCVCKHRNKPFASKQTAYSLCKIFN